MDDPPIISDLFYQHCMSTLGISKQETEAKDRAMKLAEIGKKSPIMDIVEWVIRAAIFVGAYLLAK